MVSFQKQEIHEFENSLATYYQELYCDFYIDELKIIIEVDGGVHDNQGQSNYDNLRDQILISKGYHTIRIDNQSATDYTQSALTWIKQEIDRLKT